MSSLLEEIYMHHMKKLRDQGNFGRAEAWLEGHFGGGSVGEEKNIESLVNRAKLIVNLPSDYQVMSDTSRCSKTVGTSAPSETPPIRNKDRTLTDYGRELMARGQIKYDVSKIRYSGDIMLSPVGSHEIPALVFVTTWISQRINQKFKLEGWLRVNLRFLSDYRNVLFIGLCYYVLKWILC